MQSFKKCHLKFDAVPAFSLAQGYNTFSLCYDRLLSTRVSNVAGISNVARVSLKRAPIGGRRFRPSGAVVSGRRFLPNLGRMKLAIFIFAVFFFFHAAVEWIYVW